MLNIEMIFWVVDVDSTNIKLKIEVFRNVIFDIVADKYFNFFEADDDG